ncbi:MAG: TRAP transporter small permease [Alphaproteobacteria bacterium]
MNASLSWLRARTVDVAVGLLAAMFVAFILQIFFRYVVNQPLSWTLEACLLTWLWLVFWGAAFLLKDRENVRFDILYTAVGPKMRRVFGVVAAVIIVVAFAGSSYATYDFVSFMRIESSSSLGIRLDYVFSVYLIFVAGVIGRYAWRTVVLLRGPVDETDAAQITRLP